MWSVFFVFLSYLDRNLVKGDFLDVEKEGKGMFSMLNGTFCAKMSAAGENFLYQVSDGTEVLRSVVSPSGRMVNCSVTVNHTQVKSFTHKCRLEPKEQKAAGGQQPETRFTRMDEAKVMCREFKLRSGDRMERGGTEDPELQNKVLKRSKRGFTYPGTLWCGAGNMADNYDQLGTFAETDSCCRTHDHCPHVIHAFSTKYGYTNFKWHSICHCDCDNALRNCLKRVNDSSSRVIGQAFFNVIGVPCFEFVYEEQCAERHWYGTCKQYGRFPIAVPKEAIPYDYGGIDAIDVLTLAPPKMKKEEEKLESTTLSTVSSPEEPSLTNVVTAAEDFIKVLATVSTSQSSTADSDKDKTQGSEKKKKKKKTGKTNKTKKQRGKGKGRKRKQKSEEKGAVSPSGSKTGEVIGLSDFIGESHKHEQSNRNRVGDKDYEVGHEKPSNEVMKDEPGVNNQMLTITPSVTVQKKSVASDSDALTEEISLSARRNITVFPNAAKSRRLRKGRRKKGKKVALPLSEEPVTNTTEKLSGFSVPTTNMVSPTDQPDGDTEKQTFTDIVIPTVKRNRSKERGHRMGRKHRTKVSGASHAVSVTRKSSSEDYLKVIPISRAPTITQVPSTQQQVSHRPHIHGGKTVQHVTALNSSFSVLKKQRAKVRVLKRRKTALSPPTEKPLYHNSSEIVLPALTTPEPSDASSSSTTTAAVSWPLGILETHSESRLFTTAATTITPKRHRQPKDRRQRKPRRKAAPDALSKRVSTPERTEHTTTFTTTPAKVAPAEEFSLQRSEKAFTTTSAGPTMSAIQLSIERAKAQFSTKKRRKAALSIRQQ